MNFLFLRRIFAVVVVLCLSIQNVVAQESQALPIRGSVGQLLLLDPTDGITFEGAAPVRAKWSWLERPSISVAEFSNSELLRPTVTMDVAGNYLAKLDLFLVNDPIGATPVDTVVVQLSTDNVNPVARILARGLPNGQGSLFLDGSNSYDVDGDALTYLWSSISTPAGGILSFGEADAVITDLTYEGSGEFVAALTVTDETGRVSEQTTYSFSNEADETSLACSATNGTVLQNDGSQNVLFDIGDVTNGPVINHIIRSFDTDSGNEQSFDTLAFSYLGATYELKTVHDFLQFADYIEHDGDNTSDAIISRSSSEKYLCFTFGSGRGAVLLENIVDNNLKRSALRNRSVDFPEVQDFYLDAFDVTLPNDGSNRVTFDLGNVSAGPFLDYVIPTFDTDSGNENTFDTLTFSFEGEQYSLSKVSQFLSFVSFIEHDGDTETDALVSANSSVKDLTFTFGQGKGSVTLKNVVDNNLRRNALRGRSVDYYEIPLPMSGASVRQLPPNADYLFDSVSVLQGVPFKIDAFQSSDLDGDRLGLNAELVVTPSGSVSVIASAEAGRFEVTPDLAGDYLVSLGVDDGAKSSQKLVLLSAGRNVRPRAVISAAVDPQLTELLNLDGSQSYDFDGDSLSYEWAILSKPVGSVAALLDASTPFVAITPDIAGSYVLQLQVSDADSSSLPVTIVLNVGSPLPVAEAGPDQLADSSGSAVLDGTLSQGSPLNYNWADAGLAGLSSSAGFGAATDGATSIALTQGTDGSFAPTVAQLIVSNTNGISVPDTVFVGTEAIRPIVLPSASITLNGGVPVTLVGSDFGFDAEGDVLTYQWSLLSKPDLSNAVIDPLDTTAKIVQSDQLSFTPDETGLYFIQVIANDGILSSVPAVISLTVENSAPVASVGGSLTAFVGEQLLLDGSSSFDPEGDALAFQWAIESAPSASTAALSNDVSSISEFTADRRGEYQFSLVVSDFALSSSPAFLTLTVPNRDPIAALDVAQNGETGTSIVVSAGASSDPDGDILTYSLAVLTAPNGAIPSVIETAAGEFTFEGDVAGDYTLILTVDDGLKSATQSVSINLTTPNRPPVLTALASNYSTEAGLAFALSLDATDADNDPLTYFASSLPLPSGFSLDGNTGEVRFRPEQAQVGTYEIIVGVSDGARKDTETLIINVVAGNAGQTSLSGRVLDAVDFANGVETPIAGLTVALDDNGVQTLTAADGSFDLVGLVAGQDVVVVDPNANGGPGGYLATQRIVSITDNQARDVAPAILLTPLNEGCALVTVGQDTVINGALTGVTVSIAADTITDTAGNPFAGEVCLGSLPQLTPNDTLPEDTLACQIYGLSAPGARFTSGVSLTAPNSDNLPEATALEFWQSTSSGNLRRSAQATVDAGAVTVSVAAATLSRSGTFTFLPQAPATTASADQPTGNRQLSPFEGDLNEVYALPGYFAFNQQQGVGLSYHSSSANPTPIIAGDVVIAEDASLPVTLDTRLVVGGLSLTSDAIWTPREAADGTMPALIGDTVTLRQSMPVDASGLDSGRYAYDFVARAQYDCSTVSSTHRAEFYVQNKSDSPYGPGWSVDDLQELVLNDDGTVAIIDDDGVVTFDPEPTFSTFRAAPITFDGVGVEGIAVADFDNNGFTDIAYPNSGSGAIKLVLNDGNETFVETQGIAVWNGEPVPETGSYRPNLAAIESGDFDGNGTIDIAHIGLTPKRLAWLSGDGFGDFENTILSGVNRSDDLAVADLDNDGFDDIIRMETFFFFGSADASLSVNYGSAQGPATNPRLSPIQGIGNRVPSQIMVADVDNDGALDVAFRTASGISFYVNQGNRNFSLDLAQVGNESPFLLSELSDLADINGDGFPDIVLSNNDRLEAFLNLGDGTFGSAQDITRPAGAAVAGQVNLIDVNYDGLSDLLYSEAAIGGTAIYIGVGDGSFLPPELGSLTHGVSRAVVRDMNDDGSLDLVSTERFATHIDFSDPSESGQLVAGAGEFSTLTALDGGGWERRYKDGMVVVFDENGLQTAVVDQQGNRTEFAYGVDRRLASKTDQVGGTTSFAYDADGRLQAVTYPDGRTTAFAYDDQDALVAVTEPTGSTIQYAYDENNRLVAMTNQNGNTTTYNYDAAGNMSGATLPDGAGISNQVASSLGLVNGLGNDLPNPLQYVAPEDRATTVTDRKGEITEIIVNAFGAPVQITDPLGRVTRMTRDDNNLVTRVERPSAALAGGVRVDAVSYDELANVTSMIEAIGTTLARETQYSYEPTFNNVTQMTDPDGFTTIYEYDGFGEATRVVDPEGAEMLYAYTPEGKILSETDKNGNLTSYAYDAQQNLGEMTYADGSVTQMTYDISGNTAEVAEAAGTPIERIVQRTYDSLNRVLSVEITGADGIQIDGVTTYSYLPAGNLATVTDETGLVTAMGYDGLERLTSVDDPAEGLMQRTYNVAGEVTQHVNGDGEVHVYDYDAVSRLTQTVDPGGFLKTFGYDVRDNINDVVDGRGGQTVFAFDALDRMTTRTNPIGQTMARAYDLRDNLTTLTREDGLVENATYDGLGRRTQVVTPDNTLTYAYDGRGNLTEAADDDSRVTFTYDSRNRLATTTTDGTVGPQPEVTISYIYDALDRRTTMSDSLGGTTTYAYDAEDRLTDLTAPWGTVYNFGYDGEGRRTSLTSTSGRDTRYEYANGLLTALRHTQSGVALTDLTYQYGVDAQLEAIVDALEPNKSKVIAYDGLNRLIQVAEGAPGDVTLPVEDYAYDEEGNRTASHLSSLYASNAHNQLLEDENYTYTYDERGNRTSRTAKLDGAIETYSYDSQNRFVEYASPTTTASYSYDAIERRIAKKLNGDTTAYVYDADEEFSLKRDDVILEFASLEGSATLLARLLHTPRIDEIVGQERYTSAVTPGAGSGYEIFQDRSASINRVVEIASGTVVRQTEYEGFGFADPSISNEFSYGFNGLRYDSESSLYFSRARYLDPAAGRFTQSDPLFFEGSPHNLYEFVDNNSPNHRDPSGLAVWVDNRVNNIVRKQVQANTIQTIADGVYDNLLNIFAADGKIKNLGNLNVSAGAATGATCHGNSRRNEVGIHVYQIFDIRSGETLKIGIAGNNRLLSGGRQSARALQQQQVGQAHVVVLKTPDGFMARGLGYALERSVVDAAGKVFGFEVNTMHKRPPPNTCR